MKKVKAVGLLSGGLDSTLAAKMVLDQGIDVVALNFTSPFCTCSREGRCESAEAAEHLGIELKAMPKGDDYIHVIRNPKHGYGKNMNPCIDCRIYILKKAKDFAKEIGADFIFTGEVLDQRPKSQHRRALEIIERESGLKGKLLRPLSAKLLAETEVEKKGLIDRKKLGDMHGRSRKRQMEMADDINLVDYHCAGGGCLLTEKRIAKRVRDFLDHNADAKMRDMWLLKYGRHFRVGENKIIVGRDEGENKKLLAFKKENDFVFEIKGVGSPIVVLQGRKGKKAIEMAARLAARYSDAKGEEVIVGYLAGKKHHKIRVSPARREEIEKYLI
ncbi:MAG: hypothetical protein ABH829_05530 [archaeon]